MSTAAGWAFPWTGALAVALFSVAGLAAGAISLSGAVVGWVLGVAVWAGLGWRGFALLAAFVTLGSLATRWRRERKVALGVAQSGGGRRGARHALANALVPAAAASLVPFVSNPEPWILAVAGALAAVTSDTLSSEIGQAVGGRTYLILALRPAAIGTDGAISVIGTVTGALAAATIAGSAWALGLVSLGGAVAVVAAGFAGNLLDSLLGATLEHRGFLGNEAVNFAASICGALLAALASVP
jgi:uncharacterized protein (TIGR00297 family)